MKANELGDPPQEVNSVNAAVPEWSYGYRATVAGKAFTAYATGEHINDGSGLSGIDGFETPSALNGVAVVNTNNTPVLFPLGYTLPANSMMLHPGSSGAKVVVRWTAPAAGTFFVSATWKDLDAGGGDGASGNIVVNGASSFSGSWSNAGGTSATRVATLAPGDTVDFVLNGIGGFDYDSTAFDARIVDSTTAQQLPTGSLRAYFPFETDTNSVVNGYTASTGGGASLGSAGSGIVLPGQANGKAAVFDGVDDTITTNITGGFAGGATYSVWVNLEPGGNSIGQILAQPAAGIDLDLQIHGGNELNWYVMDGSTRATAPAPLSNGEWHHIGATYTPAGNANLFVDGVLVATASTLGRTRTSNGSPVYIGHSYGGYRLFHGKIDNVAIYERALTEAEVRQAMYATVPPSINPPVTGYAAGIPYRRIADTPFAGVKGSSEYFYLEDFEDGALNTPGVTASVPVQMTPPGSSDSVDEDDGSVDGSGLSGKEMSSNGQSTVSFTFNATTLGGLPTYAGVVWTDVGVSGEGLGFGTVIFEAFDADGNSLGATPGVLLGDGMNAGQTAEDRFFGAAHPAGISKIQLTMPQSIDWGLDHVQYGRVANAFIVPGSANIYGAGHATAPAPGGDGGGLLPPKISVPTGAQKLRFTSVGGFVAVDGNTFTAPDGDAATFSVSTSATGGISAFGFPNFGVLTGVFLTDAEPVDPAPAALFTTASSGDFATLSPAIGQVFFIGNGKRADNSLQDLVIPSGATRLYLGIADAPGSVGPPGYYKDNVGGFAVRASFTTAAPVTPPSSEVVVKDSVGSSTNAGTSNPPAIRRYSLQGDPINLIFGNFVLTHTDLQVLGALASPPWIRTYNSAVLTDGLLGFGWTTSLDMRVAVVDADNRDVRRADGSVVRFTRVGATSTFKPAGISTEVLSIAGTGHTLLDADKALITFAADGRVTTIADRHANTTTFTYTGTKWTGITDPVGRKWIIQYGTNGRISAVLDPLSRTVKYAYSTAGDLMSVTDASGAITKYSYDAQHRLLTVTDPLNRVQTTNTYDGNGRVSQQQDATGTWTVTYQTGRTILTNPLGKTTMLDFDAQFRPTVATDQLGHTTETLYNNEGLVAALVDANGGVTAFEYDARGNTTKSTNALGQETRFTYNASDDVLTETDALNHVTSYMRNAAGDITSVTDATSRQTQFTVNARGLITAITDPLNHVTTFAYDTLGHPTTSTDALGKITKLVYDKVGQLLSITDPLTRKTSLVYDKLGRVVSVTAPDGGVSMNTFDKAGNLTRNADALGRASLFTYNTANDLIKVTDPLNRVFNLNYDAMGRMTSATRPGGTTTMRTYDDAGRVTAITSAANRTMTYAYDALGQLASITDANAHTLSYTHDALGRITRITDHLGGHVDYVYDAAGRQTQSIDALGQASLTTFDAAGRVLTSVNPLGHTTTSSYDAAGRLTGIALPTGQSIALTYDNADQLTALNATNPALSIAFLYDAAGQRTQMTDASGITTFAYDKAGRLIKTTSPRGIVSAVFDKEGQRTALVQPGQTTAWAYDKLGRVTAITRGGKPVVSYAYNLAGALEKETFGNTLITTRMYDADLILTGITTKTKLGATLRASTFALDPAGRRVGETSGDFTAAYVFDALDRLTSATLTVNGTPKNYSYTYDAAGNRTSITEDAVTDTMIYDNASRLVSVNGQPFTHDNAGRITGDGTSTLAYDALGRLLSIAVSGSGTFNHQLKFGYDGDDNLISETAAGITRTFLNDMTDALPMRIAETVNGATERFMPGISQTDIAGVATFNHNDALGTPRLITSATGTVLTTRHYGPFGEPLTAQGKAGLSAEPWSADSAMLHLRARFYSPVLGRFLTTDSARLALNTQSGNPYAFVMNDPVNYRDPTGLWPWDGAVEAAQQAWNTASNAVASGAQTVAREASKLANTIGSAFTGQPASPPVPPARPQVFTPTAANIISSGAGGILGKGGAGIVASGAGGGVLGKGGASVLGKGGASVLGKGGASVLGKGGASVLGNGGASVLGKGSANVLGKGGASILGKGGAGIVASGAGGGRKVLSLPSGGFTDPAGSRPKF